MRATSAKKSRSLRTIFLRYTPYFFLMPAVIHLLAVGLFPLIYSFWISLNSYELIVKGGFVSFEGVGNYVDALLSAEFQNSGFLTIIFVCLAVGSEFVLGLGLALLLNREFRGVNFLRAIIVMPLCMTPVSVGLMGKLLFESREFGIVNYVLHFFGIPSRIWLQDPIWSLPVVALVDIWQWTPFMALVFLAGLHVLPAEPFESARVDGASRWQTLRFITMPMLSSLALTAFLIRLMDATKIFDILYVMTGGGPGNRTEVLSLHIYLTGFKWMHIGYATAMSFILLLAIIITSMALSRRAKI